MDPDTGNDHHRQLTNGQDTWRARCREIGTPGSGGGSGKRTGGNTGTAPGVYLTGSGSVVSAQLASRVWTITATAERTGLNPLTYLSAYLDACAQAGGTAPQGQALTRFLPWAAGDTDLAACPNANPVPPTGEATSDANPHADPPTRPP